MEIEVVVSTLISNKQADCKFTTEILKKMTFCFHDYKRGEIGR